MRAVAVRTAWALPVPGDQASRANAPASAIDPSGLSSIWMSAARAASGSWAAISAAKRSSARVRRSPPASSALSRARRRASSESGFDGPRRPGEGRLRGFGRARGGGLDLLERRDTVALAPPLECGLEAQRGGELRIGRGGRGVGGDARRGAVVSRCAIQVGEIRSDDRIRRVAIGELAQPDARGLGVAGGVRAHRGDEREAARELRIGLERRELLDGGAGTLFAARARRRGEGLEHARQPGSARARAHLAQRLGCGLGVAPGESQPNELDVQRDRFGLGAARREQALRRLLVPGRVARDAGERPREPPGGRGRSPEHRGLAERGLRPSDIARPNGPDVRRQEERAPASLVGAEVVGERLELSRERRGVAPIREHVELEGARRQAPRVERDGPRERLEGARGVSCGCGLLGDAHGERRAEAGVGRRRQLFRGDPTRERRVSHLFGDANADAGDGRLGEALRLSPSTALAIDAACSSVIEA